MPDYRQSTMLRKIVSGPCIDRFCVPCPESKFKGSKCGLGLLSGIELQLGLGLEKKAHFNVLVH